MSLPFSPRVAEWFRERFGSPTPVQAAGWPPITCGESTLIAAPTGSGKTLAAFLCAIDRLLRLEAAGELPDTTQVVYVSPLKALGNDIQRNLLAPLAELGASELLRVLVRTGDTPPAARAAMIRRPPHVLITTPESLYILLTAEKSRGFLARAKTVIVDEIHAVAGDKRGAHLALSLERLDALAGRRLQRIGLSATQRPVEEVARLLVGATAPCTIVDLGHRRALEMNVWVPDFELSHVTTHEMWAAIYERIAVEVRANRTTIVFSHTRRMVERVAHALGERLGQERVAAHHGSMARRARLEAEERLKAGEIGVMVATGSLELGIDVGTIDLVCHLGAPRSLASLLQRIGRSGHARGAVSRGILFPLTRDDLVQAAAAVRAVAAGQLDTLSVPENALDIVAQQCAATVASGEIGIEELWELVRRAYPFRRLPRADFEAVLTMLGDGVATRRGRRGALLHVDRVHGRLRPRRATRLMAITGGGAIPDTADYEVVEEPTGTRVGSVNEDFAVESMAGDIFLLGNRSWRIRRVETGRVRVEDAAGAPPTIPFWLGEAPARTRELSQAVSELRREVAHRLGDRGSARAWLAAECRLDPAGAEQLAAYVAAGRDALGTVPSDDTVVAERFFDEAGGMQLVVHAPFGGRINRAWGLMLRKRFCRTFDFELQAAANDDALLLSLGAQHSFPLDAVFSLLSLDALEEDLAQAALPSPMFTNRWRWNATRALALARHEGGRRVPMPLQRMRADDLLAAVFPAQVACQDNNPGPVEIPDHPLVGETIGNCLHEAMDVRGLSGVLADITQGRIKAVSIDTPTPSPFAHEILNSNPHTFLDDAPLEERRARAVTLRRTDPDLAAGLGALDAAAVVEVCRQAWPEVRDADELHDLLLSVGVISARDLEAAGWAEMGAALERDQRAHWYDTAGGRLLAATERRALADGFLAGSEDALATVVGGWLECLGPTTASALATRLGVVPARIAIALAALERDGRVLRGRFTPGGAEEEWCERTLLARIHRLTLGRLRREIEPVPAADFLRFLFRWQHLHPGTQLHGREGLREIIGQLQGLELPARAWEEQVLRARIARYNPADLEQLCLAGEVAWGRLAPDAPSDTPAPRRRSPPGRAAPLAFVLRDDLPWLLAPMSGAYPCDLPACAQQVLAHLERFGASFLSDIARATGLIVATAEEAMWTLVARGLVTGDGVAGLRSLLAPDKQRAQRRLRAVRGGRARPLPSGRWALLRAGFDPEGEDPMRFARQLLHRYGVVVRELLAREPRAPRWRSLLSALRTLEARGEIRGGRFVSGLVGEQFALPTAVEVLRAVRRRHDQSEVQVVAAADPLNLVGVILPGGRMAPTLREVVAYRDGVPVERGELGSVLSRMRRQAAG